MEALNKHHDHDHALGKHPGNEHHDVSPEPSKEAGSLERAALRAASNANGCSHDLGTPDLSSVSVCEVSPERRKSPPLTSAVKRTESPPTRTPSPPRPTRSGEGETHSCSVESLGSGPRPSVSPGSRDSVRFQLRYMVIIASRELSLNPISLSSATEPVFSSEVIKHFFTMSSCFLSFQSQTQY